MNDDIGSYPPLPSLYEQHGPVEFTAADTIAPGFGGGKRRC